MSQMGQTEKNSSRVDVFRSSPESGRCSIRSTLASQQNGRASILLSNVLLALPDTQLGAGTGNDLAGTINEFGLGRSRSIV
jgi:hypothetical protein